MNIKFISWTTYYLLTICFLLNFLRSSIKVQANIEYGDKSGSSLKAKIEVQADKQIGIINPDIYGLFMEMCFYEFNGGIWAELLKNRKFAGDDGEDELYGVIRPWFPIGYNEKTYFMHDNSIFYCGNQSQKIISENDKNQRCGIEQKGLYLEKGKNYQIRLNLMQENIQGAIDCTLEGNGGIYAKESIILPALDWNRVSFVLQPTQTDSNGTFTITFTGSGKLWLGTVSMMSEDHLFGFRADVVEALRVMGPTNIRWPGGNVVSVYHWEDGIGDKDKRPPRFNRMLWEPNDVGIDEFLKLCQLIGTEPYIAVNAGDGTAQEAANLVEYSNGESDSEYGKLRAKNGHTDPYNVQLWGIGNEMYGNWQNGHVDEETYARRHAKIAKAMRVVDKNIKIVATGGRPWKYPRWNQALYRLAADEFDYLSLHSYAKKYRRFMKKEDLTNPQFADEFYYYIVSAPYGIEEQICETYNEVRREFPNKSNIKIAFDEWNCWAYRVPYEQVDFALRDGLYTAGVFHAFRRQHEAVTLANFSKVVNAIAMIRVNPYGLFFNPQYLVFKMYLNHSGSLLLASEVECDTYPAPEYEKGRPQAKRDIPYIDTSAMLNEDKSKLFLSVLNLHISKMINTKVSIHGWHSKAKGKRIWIEGANYNTENTFESPYNIVIREEEFEEPGSSFSYHFPPHSLTIFELLR